MRHVELINQFRTEIATLVHEIETSVAMGHFDINKICEDVVRGLFKELYGYSELRNLNAEEKNNFPGIDLADDKARVAIQVASDKSLGKIKDTLEAVVRHNLFDRYDRLIVYILTKKQDNYSDEGLRTIVGDRMQFDVKADVMDHRDLARKAANIVASVMRLRARPYDSGVGSSSDEPGNLFRIF